MGLWENIRGQTSLPLQKTVIYRILRVAMIPQPIIQTQMLSTLRPLACRWLTTAPKTLMDQIEKIVEERIRPVLQMDGGDVKIRDVVDGEVQVTLTGHCAGCPVRRSTLENGILLCLQEEIPEIKSIREIDDNV